MGYLNSKKDSSNGLSNDKVETLINALDQNLTSKAKKASSGLFEFALLFNEMQRKNNEYDKEFMAALDFYILTLQEQRSDNHLMEVLQEIQSNMVTIKKTNFLPEKKFS